MNRIEREALTEKVRRSDNPYEALFGTDAVGRRGKRRWVGDKVSLPPTRLLPDKNDRHRLAQKIHQRTNQILKHLDPDLYRDIYNAEMKIAVAKLGNETPDQDLVRKYGRRLMPAKGSGSNG